MRQITLNVPDQHYAAFLQVVEKLGYVDVASDEDAQKEIEIPEWQQQIILNRMAGPQTFADWEEVEKRLREI